MVKIRLIFLLFIAYSSLYGQESADDRAESVNHTLKIESGILISAKSRIPFWMKSNTSDRFNDQSANSQYYIFSYSTEFRLLDNLNIGGELESILTTREKINGRFVQANLYLESDLLTIQGGYNEEFFGLNDSTLSIGNLIYGNNARPVPKFSISTNGWKKSPIFGKNLSFKAYLAHGKFEQNRYQSGAFLHQKYFYFKIDLVKNHLSLIGGLNHNAQWGGSNSLNETVQPVGFKNYGKIFLGSSGGNDALLTDQQNALGNHLGSYDLRGSYNFRNLKITNYWQFLWEDKSGLTPFNWRDGLMGISADFRNSKKVKKVVIEIIRTNNQGAQKVADDGTPIFEPDNFMNNGVYRTGWSFHDRVIGNPIFLILNSQSISNNRIKNSLNALNIGLEGELGKLTYKINYIDFKNKGTKAEIITPTLRMKSLNFVSGFKLNQKINLGIQINYQTGDFDSKENIGLRIYYQRSLLF